MLALTRKLTQSIIVCDESGTPIASVSVRQIDRHSVKLGMVAHRRGVEFKRDELIIDHPALKSAFGRDNARTSPLPETAQPPTQAKGAWPARPGRKEPDAS